MTLKFKQADWIRMAPLTLAEKEPASRNGITFGLLNNDGDILVYFDKDIVSEGYCRLSSQY